MSNKFKYLIGIDEVGRGPIAGPVAVGAFALLDQKALTRFRGVRDSKQLSADEREEWFEKILDAEREGLIDFQVVFQNHSVIDTKGLSYAIKKCLKTSLEKLNLEPTLSLVLLDGGLKAPEEYIYQKTIIRGDAKEKVIALASICAKVLRDRKMEKWAKTYPDYGFEVHKGYGTARHYAAIRTHGLCPLHRQSFLQKRTT